MSELTKSFEQEFPLPWRIEEYQAGTIRAICPASGDNIMYFGIFDGWDAPQQIEHEIQNYLVKCANLMPEAVEVIRDLIGIAAVLDYGADNAVMRAKQLLAKLEGGAEE